MHLLTGCQRVLTHQRSECGRVGIVLRAFFSGHGPRHRRHGPRGVGTAQGRASPRVRRCAEALGAPASASARRRSRLKSCLSIRRGCRPVARPAHRHRRPWAQPPGFPPGPPQGALMRVSLTVALCAGSSGQALMRVSLSHCAPGRWSQFSHNRCCAIGRTIDEPSVAQSSRNRRS